MIDLKPHGCLGNQLINGKPAIYNISYVQTQQKKIRTVEPTKNTKCNSEKPCTVDLKHTNTPWTNFDIWVFPKIGVPQNGCFFWKTLLKFKWDDLGVLFFLETSILEPPKSWRFRSVDFPDINFREFFGEPAVNFPGCISCFKTFVQFFYSPILPLLFFFAHPIWKNNISSIWIISPIFRVKVKTSLNNCHLDGSVSIVLKPQFSPLKMKLLHSTWTSWNFIGNLRTPASCDSNFGPTNMTSEILVGGFNPLKNISQIGS